MMARVLIGLAGLGALVYGGVLLLANGWADLVDTAVWLAGGVVLHDFVLVPATLAVCWVGARLIPPGRRPPVAAALLVLGTLTLLAVPVLGRFGARPDNLTLLDRNYPAGWAVVSAIVCTAVVATLVFGARRNGVWSRASRARRR